MDYKRLTLFAGHYGSGKTNLALNYALWLKGRGLRVTAADLDIVNPYFRTKDGAALLEQAGIPAGSIQVCGIDTYTTEAFFSARREGAHCGRIINAIRLATKLIKTGSDI